MGLLDCRGEGVRVCLCVLGARACSLSGCARLSVCPTWFPDDSERGLSNGCLKRWGDGVVNR